MLGLAHVHDADLLGEKVRFNGGHKRGRFLTHELGPYVDWLPYCPDMEIGLGPPREPLRLTADGRLITATTGSPPVIAPAG